MIYRNLFTDNIIATSFQSYKTELKNPKNLSINETERWEITDKHVNQTNITGLILVAIVFGIAVSFISKEANLLVDLLCFFNRIVLNITDFIINLVPIGVLFLILPQILAIDNIPVLFQRVGLFTITVLLGLAIHMFVVLPLIYFMMTGKNPFRFMFNMMSAICLAFGTSSSSATMPVIIDQILIVIN